MHFEDGLAPDAVWSIDDNLTIESTCALLPERP
jgi:hypothetical protein